MRIAVSNPDNIGDFILRQPMIAAFLEEGHEVLLLVRDFVAPLAMDLFPEATVMQCAGNPYSRDFSLDTPLGQRFREQFIAFAPDVFVVAAYQHTQLEELLAASIAGMECVGFTGYLYQARAESAAVSTIQYATRVAAAKESSELAKNNLLCSAVLGHDVRLSSPQMEAKATALAEARELLRQHGLEDQPFWAVCAGDAPNKSVRNWAPEKWAECCRSLVEKQSATLLFIGSPEEHEATVAIQEAMGEAGARTATITGGPIKLDVLTGILQLSSGYIGKDTGPMHIAAALGKPVLSVFGGGDWPRFLPAAATGATITVHVPCVGCGWDCHLSRSHCVKDIPVAAVLGKAEELVRGTMAGFTVEALQPDRVLQAAILRDLLASVRTEQARVAAERANFMQWHEDRMRDITRLQEELAESVAEQERQRTKAEAAEAARAALEEEGRLASLSFQERRQKEMTEVEERTRALEERAAALEFESRLATMNGRQAMEDRAAAERRLERFRQAAMRKIADARKRAQAARGELDALRGMQGNPDGHDDWKARWEAAVAEGLALRERLEEARIQTDRLRVQQETGDGRQQGLLADQEQMLKRKSAELASALALIPDLRDELAALTHDVVERDSRINDLTNRLWEAEKAWQETQSQFSAASEELRIVSEDHAARLVVIEALARELKEAKLALDDRQKLLVIQAAEIETIEKDRAQRLELIHSLSDQLAQASNQLASRERDCEERLQLIHQLSADLAAIKAEIGVKEADVAAKETDLANLGEQIQTLHAHTIMLETELKNMRNLLPYRILKQLHIL